MSDKALGALRLAVADNEHLRDVLRMSEDPKRPERKIQFFVAVYQHLRERIRREYTVPMIRWKLSNRWRSNLAV
ncbi:hypothetical protein ACLB1E_27195 [Escherichia coli]